ncbi:hypothetical protein F5884DRAFT_172316 [Xylogone sp. PMI_703]|nr:hypothetical protein F5884DRAFT_172316 [Xylogone sp. PMI_703]
MSASYDSSTAFVGAEAQSSREVIEELGLNHSHFTSPQTSAHLSPYDRAHTISNSASPSLNIQSTPGDSFSDYSAFDQSNTELGDVDDEFLGVNFSDEWGPEDLTALSNTHLDDHIYQTFRDINLKESDILTQVEAATTVASAEYPLTPLQSTKATTVSPTSDLNDPSDQHSISQQELTTRLKRSGSSNISQRPAALQLTPDHSGGSSDTSAEEVKLSTMPYPETSPQLTISRYDDDTQPLSEGRYQGTDDDYFGSESYMSGGVSHIPIARDGDGFWKPSGPSGTSGIDPDGRKALSDMEVPNFKDQENANLLEEKMSQVEAWKSTATQTPQPDAELTPRPKDMEEAENDISEVSDTASIRDNKIIEGQVYYNFQNPALGEADRELSQQPLQWNDAPVFPKMTETRSQPETAEAAIRRFKNNADALSMISRQATWGTRRRSEPSIAEMEFFTEGGFFKRLAISKEKDEKPRQYNFIDHGRNSLSRLSSLVRKSSNKHKRALSSTRESFEDVQQSANVRVTSQSNLAPPSRAASHRRPTPNVNTALAAMAGTVAAVGTTHARSGSVSAAASPKSPAPLAQARSFISRHRSKSELPGITTSQDQGLMELLRGHGGPPVANLAASPAQPDVNITDMLDQDEDEDDDDDEQIEEMDYKSKIEVVTEPIIPTPDGFKAHVIQLNPGIDNQHKWLVSRIAHQQEVRFKTLLEARVTHAKVVNNRSCPSNTHCVGLGGSATLLDARGRPRELPLQGEFSEEDAGLAEGALTDDSFPPGVPMPPVRFLPAEFECPLCFKVKKFQKPSDWTKHVHEDVQPFTCTYDKCKDTKSFKRKADWVRHENERHRHLEWWVCEMDDCKHPCYRKDNFLQHLVREHKLPEPKEKTKAAIKKSRYTEPAWIMLEKCHHETDHRPEQEPCKFCGKTFTTWKKLTVHLAKHMEQISLPVLKLVETRDVDASTIISPVKEKESEPVTPIGRPKLESHSPANMDHIPSHPLGSPFPPFQQPYFSNPTPFTTSPQVPQTMGYSSNAVYQPSYAMSMGQQRQYGSLDSSLQPISHPRDFGSMDSAFLNQPNPNFPIPTQPPQNHNYMRQGFTSAPSLSAFHTDNMLGINNGGFDFDPISTENIPAQQFHPTPMTSSSMSPSMYGQAPQGPYYHQ